MNVILKQYIDIEVERITNNIISSEISKVMVNNKYNSFLNITKNDGVIENISYNTKEINKLTDMISNEVQHKLWNLEVGDLEGTFLFDNTKKRRFKNIKNGIICDVSLGSIRNSTLFANVGPLIPIKLTFVGQVNVNLDVKIREYGINNVIIEIYAVIGVVEHASMPLTSKNKEIVISEPISIEIIKGEIPDYYNGLK